MENNCKEIIEKAYKIANNAIFFDDISDYETALYKICQLIKPNEEVGTNYIS